MRRAVAIAILIGSGPALAACGSSKSNGAAGGASTSGSASTQPEVSPQGDIPDSQVYVPYADAAGLYAIKVPEGWARTVSGGTASFTDKLNTVRVETVASAAAPTVSSATATEVPAIARAGTHYKAGTVTLVTRRSGPVVRITYRASSEPNAVTGKTIALAVERYEYWAKGTEAIVTLSGPVGADNIDPWRLVTDSFAWK